MTRPSDLPLRYKVGMVAALVMAIGAWALLVRWVFYDLLPASVASAIGFVGFGFALGGLFGYRLATREIAASRLPTTTD